MTDLSLKEQINNLPNLPGVYKYFDSHDSLIYVGKAKDLKKRVGSYFLSKNDYNFKTRKLVSLISRLEYTLVETEYDALLLENSLIKQHQPKYNINLKDDKSYPFVVVTNELYPRIFPTRRRYENQGTYYGPFASVVAVKNVLELTRKLYHIRTCKLNITEEAVKKKKFKVCLEYHIGNCLGPCEGLQSPESYNAEIEEAANVISGKISIAKNYLKQQMQTYASELAFEKAQRYKERLDLLDKYQAETIIVNPDLPDTDVITYKIEDEHLWYNYMQIRYGTIVYSVNNHIPILTAEAESTASTILHELRTELNSHAVNILSNAEIEFIPEGSKLTIPQIGDKKKLLELSLKNILFYKREVITNKLQQSEKTNNSRLLSKMQYDLKLTAPPKRIECFDNSNIQGTSPVASMVCFINGKPAKKEYRHFNIKTVEGPNDFASMKEIVYRRYKRVLEEKADLPDLIVIDGGKGQLSSAIESLKELNIYGQVPVIGIAKRLEELFYPEDDIPLYLDKKSETIRVIQQIRDEAHRFAITFHRNKRSANNLKLSLQDIEGVGPKTILRLQRHFRSFKNITPDKYLELTSLVGEVRANLILEYLKNERGDA